MLIENIIKPFYNAGLAFECQRCSTCCRHTPGYVFLSLNDLKTLIEAMEMTEKEFLFSYCRIVPTSGGEKVSLKEKENYDCIFWEEGGCIRYSARPFQCRSYPFWKMYLETRYKWESSTSFCPGIGKGLIHSKEEIEGWLDKVSREKYFYI